MTILRRAAILQDFAVRLIGNGRHNNMEEAQRGPKVGHLHRHWPGVSVVGAERKNRAAPFWVYKMERFLTSISSSSNTFNFASQSEQLHHPSTVLSNISFLWGRGNAHIRAYTHTLGSLALILFTSPWERRERAIVGCWLFGWATSLGITLHSRSSNHGEGSIVVARKALRRFDLCGTRCGNTLPRSLSRRDQWACRRGHRDFHLAWVSSWAS